MSTHKLAVCGLNAIEEEDKRGFIIMIYKGKKIQE
jgi:hypothetical protein